MSDDKKLNFTQGARTIISAGQDWLAYLNEIDTADEKFEYAREIPCEIQYTLEPLCEITEIHEVNAEHVALYWVVTHRILSTGRWKELSSRVRDDHAGPTYDKELYRRYLEDKLILLRRFFAFCWARGYIGHGFLRWSWREEDLVRLAKLTRTEPFLQDRSRGKSA